MNRPACCRFWAGLREVFAPRHAWAPARSLRVLLHLRCGDTADVPLVGPVNYRVWGDHVRVARPALATPFVGARLAMDAVRDSLGPARAEFRVFSDGYESTARSAARLGDDVAAQEYRLRAAEATSRSVANYRAAITWATSRDCRPDADALRDEARRVVGPDADLPQSGSSRSSGPTTPQWVKMP